MTPLAHRIVKELTLPIKDRTFNDQCGLLKRMDDIHCFDISEAFEAVCSLSSDVLDSGCPDTACFLPAPKTWIEFVKGSVRSGALIEESCDGFRVTVAERWPREFFSYEPKGLFDGAIQNSPLIGLRKAARECKNPATAQRMNRFADAIEAKPDTVDFSNVSFLAAALAVINTPRIIGRRQHMPHRGLERRLLAQRPVIGKFPLHAWTEILLKVTPPKDESDEPSHEAHLTGARALHFCRAHLRIQNGKVVFVKAHWRGDGSLGIKQSRYKVAA
jgi:hypothetical protein